jgi:hypothetical protein
MQEVWPLRAWTESSFRESPETMPCSPQCQLDILSLKTVAHKQEVGLIPSIEVIEDGHLLAKRAESNLK